MINKNSVLYSEELFFEEDGFLEENILKKLYFQECMTQMICLII